MNINIYRFFSAISIIVFSAVAMSAGLFVMTFLLMGDMTEEYVTVITESEKYETTMTIYMLSSVFAIIFYALGNPRISTTVNGTVICLVFAIAFAIWTF